MTYVPPDRDEAALDQTRQLDITPPPPAAPGTGLPAVGNGVDSQSAQPIDPFAGHVVVPVEYTEPKVPRDRVVFQFIWGGILLLLTLNVLFLIYRREDEIFGGEFGTLAGALETHALYLTPVLLAALAIGMSLRLGAVNLAVPAVAVTIAYATPIETNLWIYLGYAAGAAVVAGLLYTLLVAAFRVPPWFAGLAIGVVVFAAIPVVNRLAESSDVGSPELWEQANGYYLFGGAAVLAVGGGLLGLLPGVRDGFSAVKRMADGDGERSASAVFLLLGGTVLSMLLAAGSGFLMLAYSLVMVEEGSSLAFGPYTFGAAAIDLQLLGFAAVLLGGTSLWGRRGGVLGVVLATVAIWGGLVLWGKAVADAGEGSWQAAYSQAIFAGVLLLGLFVSFGLDRLGRPKEPLESEEQGYTQEMMPFDSPNGAVPVGTGLFEPTLPDAQASTR